jgi:hypothetical protein
LLFHWKEESQHAVLDELEWRREHARLDAGGRDRGVDDLIGLVAAVDAIVQAQAQANADAHYFLRIAGRAFGPDASQRLRAGRLDAHRWQYIVSGMRDPRFSAALASMVTSEQARRIDTALAPLLA